VVIFFHWHITESTIRSNRLYHKLHSDGPKWWSWCN